SDNLDSRILFLEKHGIAHNTSCSTHRAYEMRDIALGIPPDFWPRSLVMRKVIIWIRKLVEDKIICLRALFLGVVPACFDRLQQGHLRTEGLHGKRPLTGRVCWHDQ